MIPRIRNMFGPIRSFWRNTHAVAAVEFAGILPLMLTLYVGSVELVSAISVDKRVATVSGSLGDLVARTKTDISSSTIDDYFLAAKSTMAPYDSATVQQIVTCVHVKADGTAKVGWSVADNGATAHIRDSVYSLPADLKNLALDSYVIVSEAQMSYAPLFGLFFNTAFNLYHEYYFLPRFGEEIKLDTTNSCNVT
jgi:Flp pilus assembly protein TadG